MPVSDLTIEKILTEILKVLQSKKSIQLDSAFKVEVITIRRSVGAGRSKVANISLDRLRKKSIFSIPTDDDNLCCAKAIVFALAHAKKDSTAMEAIRKHNRPALKKSAQELSFSLLTINGDNQVTYKGKERPLRINLWHHDNHYDAIKSVNGFFGSSYYYENCEKPNGSNW
ncbi:DNA-directed DNA polymerase [Caerostris darwini]|uniref:DNA-directed DNA polymerase n=1 Tax=Caerostris darwini TaxID=1538125 RepID=A0AAV4R6X7_9ARAC|nr:DNA-directed DNA polymerase [Caerostris darwini]